MTDEDGYPTDEELKYIEAWEGYDFPNLITYIKGLWWHQYGWHEEICQHGLFSVDGVRVSMSTGGWSGNEDLICAMQKACKGMFWTTCWLQSRRGGHYIFEVAEPRK